MKAKLLQNKPLKAELSSNKTMKANLFGSVIVEDIIEMGVVDSNIIRKIKNSDIGGILLSLDDIRGKDGEKGEKGNPGYTPIKNIDYKDGKNGLNGQNGKDGREVEIEVIEEIIKRRYKGEKDRKDIVALERLKGKIEQVIVGGGGASQPGHTHMLSEITPNIDYDMGSNRMSASGFGGAVYKNTFSTDIHDLDTGGIYNIIIDADVDIIMTGIIPPDGVPNAHMDIVNIGRRGLTIKHEDILSIPNNQFSVPDTEGITLRENEGARFIRDDETGFWQYEGVYLAVVGGSTEVQYRSGSRLGGAGRTLIEPTNGVLQYVAGASPSTPSANNLYTYSQDIAGNIAPFIISPDGAPYGIQSAMWSRAIYTRDPTTAVAGLWSRTVGTGNGVFTNQTPATTNKRTTIKRGVYSNVVTTLNQVLGIRNTESIWFRGNQPGHGGFFFYCKAGATTRASGGRFFAGFHTATTVVSANPSELNNTVGFCIDDTDGGTISFLTRDTSATKTSTGMTLANNTGFEMYIYCTPNSSSIGRYIKNINTGATASGVATANLPSATQILTAGVLGSNGALTTANAIQVSCGGIYIETII